MTTTLSVRLEDDLRRLLGPVRAERWDLPRDDYAPRIDLIRDSNGVAVAASLTSRRSATAAVKIVDLWWQEGEGSAAAELLDRILARSVDGGDAAVKWEMLGHQELPGFAAERGFTELTSPYPSAAGTTGRRGFSRWHREIPHGESPYYGQTTLYTCGAVAGLLAMEIAGSPGFSGGASSGDRDLELAFWRRASNFPAIEPVGLGVAMREILPAQHGIEVYLDHSGPVLIESYSGFEHDFRAELQTESLRQADALGVPVLRERITVAEIARRVANGELALLLIDEAPMHGSVEPHWVLAHAADADYLVIEDPWINSDAGETWVDTHDLPISHVDLDGMLAWDEAGYRGVVFLGRA